VLDRARCFLVGAALQIVIECLAKPLLLRELSARIVRERLPLPVIGVGAFFATPATATRVRSAPGVQQATQTGRRLGFDR
jgi:hypothetical protein